MIDIESINFVVVGVCALLLMILELACYSPFFLGKSRMIDQQTVAKDRSSRSSISSFIAGLANCRCYFANTCSHLPNFGYGYDIRRN